MQLHHFDPRLLRPNLLKFGRIQGVTTTQAIVSDVITSVPFINFADGYPCRVQAGGDAGDVDTTGAGARQIKIAGLDEIGMYQEATIALAGASASEATTEKWSRIFRAWVFPAGTYYTSPLVVGTNIGDIIIETTGSVLDRIAIEAGQGQSEHAVYTVPLGKTAQIESVVIEVDGNQAANIFLYQRRNYLTIAAPVSAKRIIQGWSGISGGFSPPSWRGANGIFPPLTDIWFEAASQAATTDVDAELHMIVR